MERNEAAEEFAKMLYQDVGEGYESVFDSLKIPRGQHKEKWEEVRQWYEKQDEEGQRLVHYLVKEAIVLGVFGLAVKFDGASAYHYVGERPAEFAVSIRVYSNEDAAETEPPEEIIEICPTQDGDEVHDLFLDLVDGPGDL